MKFSHTISNLEKSVFLSNTNKKLKMEMLCQNEFNPNVVIMPWDDQTEITISKNDGEKIQCSRWRLIQKQLHISKTISNIDELIKIINSYNVITEKDGRQSKANWKFYVLKQYFLELDKNETNKFFQDNGILATIRNLTLQLKELVPEIRVLRTGCSTSVVLHQIQIASILASAFLCTFPKQKADCPSINFNTLFESTYTSVQRNCVEKIKCIMNYFKRIHATQPSGNLLFHRLCILDHKFPRWDKTNAGLCSLKVNVQEKIEDQEGFLQMDFANKYVGGGVLGRGCVQEEIRFIVCPELIAARLFTESLADNESLFIKGAERYCQYTGYAQTFKFSNDYQDSTPFDENRCRKTYLIVLDALYFNHSSEQYRESKILRELKKAYVGFKPCKGTGTEDLPLATGNWGCGAFGGDPQLKLVLQLMASSEAQRDMLYLTFGNVCLKNQILEIYQFLVEQAVNVGMLYRIIRLYNRERKKNQTVFEFVKESVSKCQKRNLSVKTFSDFTAKQGTSSTFTSEYFPTFEETKSKLENKEIENKKSEKNFSLELNLDFEALDREIQNHALSNMSSFVVENKDSQQRFSSSISKKSDPETSVEHSSILDLMWIENEVNSSESPKRKCERRPPAEKDSEKIEIVNHSPSLFSDEESNNFCSQVKNEDVDVFHVTSSPSYNKTPIINTNTSEKSEIIDLIENNTLPKKLIQSKISQFFGK